MRFYWVVFAPDGSVEEVKTCLPERTDAVLVRAADRHAAVEAARKKAP